MQWLAQNWFWVLLFIVFIAMHDFGHGHHGGGHKHGKHKQPDKDDKNLPPSGHQH